MPNPNTNVPKQLRSPVYRQNLVKGAVLNQNAGNGFTTQFKMGPGYYETILTFYITVTTVGSAAAPVSEGILKYFRQIEYKSDNNEVFVDNLSARELFKIAQVKAKTAPHKDEMTATAATFRIEVPIYHWDPLAKRPEDTVLVTSRYNSMELNITTGPLSDLFGTTTGLVISVTCDIDVWRSKDNWDPAAKIIGYKSYGNLATVDAYTNTSIDVDKAEDIWYDRMYLHASTSGTAGMPAFGTNSDAIINRLTVDSSEDTFLKQAYWYSLQDENKRTYSQETWPAGWAVLDFVRDKSNFSALFSNRASLAISWDNQAGVAANSIITACMEMHRALRPAKKAA